MGRPNFYITERVWCNRILFATIAYRIVILPLINNIKHDISDVTEPWYADNAGTLGMFAILETYFYSITRQGLEWGYHPKLSKSVLIICLDNIEAVKVFGRRHGFKVCTWARYLGSYIRDDESKLDWIKDRTLTWDMNVSMISVTTGKYPHESYAVVVCAIQSEWIFLPYVNSDTKEAFTGVEKSILETLFAWSFFWKNINPLPQCSRSKYNSGQ